VAEDDGDDGMILHSPTERGEVVKSLIRLAEHRDITVLSSGKVEPLGVDYCWMPDHSDAWYGIQRKELHDFIASVNDGRLAKEIAQMKAAIMYPVLAFEGKVQLTNDGQVITKRQAPNVAWSALLKQFLTISSHGVQIMFTNSATATAELIVVAYEWSRNVNHSTGATRPMPANDWGALTNRDFQVHMLQGIDGIGRKTAQDIIDTLGRCPLRVDATMEELLGVPGIGELTARKIIETINGKPATKIAKRGKPMKGVDRGKAKG